MRLSPPTAGQTDAKKRIQTSGREETDTDKRTRGNNSGETEIAGADGAGRDTE